MFPTAKERETRGRECNRTGFQPLDGGSECWRSSWGCAPRWYETATLALWWLVGPPGWRESEVGEECSIPQIRFIAFHTIFLHEPMKHSGDCSAEGQIHTGQMDLRF